MAESAALLVDEVLPHEPMRQWVLSVPFPLRFLFASQPKIMGKALGIVYRTIATHLTRYLERQGLLERDVEHSTLALDDSDEEPMDQLRGHSITYRIAVGPQQGRKVFTLQTLPGIEEPFSGSAGQAAGFSLHASVAAKAQQRDKLERLCRYIALQGSRVLRCLGTIASALARPYPKSGCH